MFARTEAVPSTGLATLVSHERRQSGINQGIHHFRPASHYFSFKYNDEPINLLLNKFSGHNSNVKMNNDSLLHESFNFCI